MTKTPRTDIEFSSFFCWSEREVKLRIWAESLEIELVAKDSECKAKVIEALEEAAKICEGVDDDDGSPDTWDWHAKDYAKAIRELIEKRKGK